MDTARSTRFPAESRETLARLYEFMGHVYSATAYLTGRQPPPREVSALLDVTLHGLTRECAGAVAAQLRSGEIRLSLN